MEKQYFSEIWPAFWRAIRKKGCIVLPAGDLVQGNISMIRSSHIPTACRRGDCLHRIRSQDHVPLLGHPQIFGHACLHCGTFWVFISTMSCHFCVVLLKMDYRVAPCVVYTAGGYPACGFFILRNPIHASTGYCTVGQIFPVEGMPVICDVRSEFLIKYHLK